MSMASPATLRREQGRDRVFACVKLAFFVQLILGVPALTGLGVPYALPYGSVLFKFHPGTYLLVLALLLSLVADGNPLTVLVQRLRAQPGLALYLGAILSTCAYALVRHGMSGAAFYINTLVAPAIAVLVLVRLDVDQQRRLLGWMLALLLLNALIALGEAMAGRTLIPLNIGGELITFEGKFRATALLGHPLENGLITSIMLLALLDLPTPLALKLLMLAIFMLALLAFGGRTSVVLDTVALLALGLARVARGLRHGRFGYQGLLASATAVIFLLPAALALLGFSGLGDRVFEGLRLDHSASVRLRIYDVFDHLDTAGLLFGLSPPQIVAVSARIGLDPTYEAIENFWLLMLLQLGVPMFLLFAAGLACGCLWLWRLSGSGGRWALLVFLATASTTNSLASKTPALTLLFSILLCTAACRRKDP